MSPALQEGTADAVTRRLFAPQEEWEAKDRASLQPHQLPPKGTDWDLWLLEAGRGAGKTEACSRYYTKYMRQHSGCRGRIIAPTYGDAVESCIRGPSGLKTIDPEVRWVPSDPGGGKVFWPNGSEALVLGTPHPADVDRLRAGGNRELDWWEEIAANPQLGGSGTESSNGAWDQAQFGLRLGWPHSIASTTPRNTTAYRQVRVGSEGLRVVLTKATIFDNEAHLPASFIEQMKARYGGTRLGRQELLGELLEDVEGALWSRRVLEACRVDEAPDLDLAAIAIDPAVSSGPAADDTGIIGGGLGVDAHGYVLLDRTCHLGPDGWAKRAIRAYELLQADRIVAEVNNGGEMVEHTIHSAEGGENIYVESVHASRGKATRAQPIAALFGEPGKRESRVHLVGSHPELEDQLCTWVPGEEDSPDRLDAMVWLLTSVMLGATAPPEGGVQVWG